MKKEEEGKAKEEADEGEEEEEESVFLKNGLDHCKNREELKNKCGWG